MATVPETTLEFVDGVAAWMITVHCVLTVWYEVFPVVPCVLNARSCQLGILPEEPLQSHFRMIGAHSPSVQRFRSDGIG